MITTNNYNIKDNIYNKDNILKLTNEHDIFRHFLGFDFNIKTNYISPLRDDDTNPSFNIFYNKNKLLYKDWGHSTGDCFTFVMHLKNVDFYNACILIANEMNLFNKNKKKVYYNNHNINYTINYKTQFQYKLRQWNNNDFKYWNQYKINKDLLKLYKIYPAKEVWIKQQNDSWKRCWINTIDNPIYLFFIRKYNLDDKLSFNEMNFKAYRPYQIEEYNRNSSYKWLNAINNEYIQGLEQLEYKTDNLFITSSLKDIMVLKNLNIEAIAPNAEGSYLNNNIIEYLKSKYKNIYVNYDSDNSGVRTSKIFTEKYNLKYWNIPKEYLTKDVSDFVKKYNYDLLNKLIKLKINL